MLILIKGNKQSLTMKRLNLEKIELTAECGSISVLWFVQPCFLCYCLLPVVQHD